MAVPNPEEPRVAYYPAAPKTITFQADFSHLRYARGYVFSTGPDPEVPEFWLKTPFKDGIFRWDPRVPVVKASAGRSEVLLCGNAMSTTLEEDDPRVLVETLLTALSNGRGAYLDELEDFTGQYIVMDSTEELRAQTDAIGSRAMFHNPDASILASHAAIVARAVAAEASRYLDWVAEPTVHEFPGRTTAYQGVWLLIPNTEVVVGKGDITRIGPRPFEPRTVTQAQQEILPLLQTQVRLLLAGPRQVLVSASAGVDSRTSLAAFAHAGDQVQFFTYTREPGAGHQSRELNRDRLAADICHDLGLPHRLLHLDRQEPPPKDYLDMLASASIRRSNGLTSWTYHQHLPHDAVHIRGQINGVGKWHFAKRLHFTEPLELTARRMAELTKRGRAMQDDPTSPLWDVALEGFQDYIDTTELRSVPNGYRIPDLFLWEHRVGQWNHAHIVESDVTFDTHQIFASRRILRLLLSVPDIDRVQLSLFRDIIRELEPKLLDYELNGEAWTEPQHDLSLPDFQTGTTRKESELRKVRQSLARTRRSAQRETASRRRLEGELDDLTTEVQRLTALLDSLESRRRALSQSKLGRAQRKYWSLLHRWRGPRGRP